MTDANKRIILLVGPKGAGKSHIGKILEEERGYAFVRVEEIWQKLYRERTDFGAPAYEAEGTALSLAAINKSLAEKQTVVVETTATQGNFCDYLTSLRHLARLYLVNVRASLDACKERLRNRDQDTHVPLPDGQIDALNARAAVTDLKWDMVLENDPFLSKEKIVSAFAFLSPLKAPAERAADLPDNVLPLGERVIERLRTVYDPEIPVNVYDLGLITNIDIKTREDGLFDVTIDMTLTTPNCPIADQIPIAVQEAVQAAEGAGEITVNLVWDPPWDRSRMTDEARMQLDMF